MSDGCPDPRLINESLDAARHQSRASIHPWQKSSIDSWQFPDHDSPERCLVVLIRFAAARQDQYFAR
jgi:hypothetical protein